GGVTELVICGGGGVETILIDAQGNPVDPENACRTHYCTLCFAADNGVLPVGASGLMIIDPAPGPNWPVVSRFTVSARRFPAQARAPPFKGQTA
ncbi:MAG: hypothetical protein U1D06_02510, partial [Paracoccaceae bacterium]|nr:hypothetical protein [Paracoccaceae bacterium]